ncbi:protein trichome birefringence-like 36 [Dorcoceras hygrometricum]|uniref:Protein trichome birefringence-like 36 n=1 Tax=Dorcoceras hygrometricum TaxID=472368 RepID=A0A2Z7CVC1_9LAMI|nr:protein trichome birefringence-like 36 [Dorcoceras hygrometricum]
MEMIKFQSSQSLYFFLFFTACFCFSYSEPSSIEQDDELVTVRNGLNASPERCDFSKGKWVYDRSYPLYEYSTCPYLSTAVACRKNGRPDSDYEKWRWKPDACSLSRFDSLDFLGKMRRKRIMLVGDSIMRNQWESLVCLVQSVIPNARKTNEL